MTWALQCADQKSPTSWGDIAGTPSGLPRAGTLMWAVPPPGTATLCDPCGLTEGTALQPIIRLPLLHTVLVPRDPDPPLEPLHPRQSQGSVRPEGLRTHPGAGLPLSLPPPGGTSQGLRGGGNSGRLLVMRFLRETLSISPVPVLRFNHNFNL